MNKYIIKRRNLTLGVRWSVRDLPLKPVNIGKCFYVLDI